MILPMNSLVLKGMACLLLVVGTQSMCAQETIPVKETVAFLNTKLRGQCTLKVKRETLYAEFIKRGAMYRKDKVILDEIDTTAIAYMPEENGVVMKCLSQSKDCILRELPERGIIRNYDRIKFNSTDADQAALVKALTHLVKTIQNDSYRSTEPFE